MRSVTLKRLTQRKNGNLFRNFLSFTPELAASAGGEADRARQSQDWAARAWATTNLPRQLTAAKMKKPGRESFNRSWFGIFIFFFISLDLASGKRAAHSDSAGS